MSEIPRFHSAELIIPRSARGYSNNDFIQFNWIPSIDPSQFRVLVEDLSGRWINLGTLKERVLIPNTYFPEHAYLIVVGKNRHDQQVRYIGTLRRAQLYILDSSKEGDHTMRRFIPQNRM